MAWGSILKLALEASMAGLAFVAAVEKLREEHKDDEDHPVAEAVREALQDFKHRIGSKLEELEAMQQYVELLPTNRDFMHRISECRVGLVLDKQMRKLVPSVNHIATRRVLIAQLVATGHDHREGWVPAHLLEPEAQRALQAGPGGGVSEGSGDV
mmetsp:Transcript_27003/g.84020  ORF Transcript_27003/g.84020 Transcript_27003/m.84020 type:complete len:155 (-) Transcript_27003:38-502(-)